MFKYSEINYQNYYITFKFNSKKIAIINCSLEIVKIILNGQTFDLIPSPILIPYEIKKIEREKFAEIKFVKFDYIPTIEGKQIINEIADKFKNFNRIIIIVPEKCANAYKELNFSWNIRICSYSDLTNFKFF